MSVKLVCLLAVTAMIGCASGPRNSPVSPRMARILNSEEVFAAKADQGSAYDAIARLRPNWLAVHGVSSFDAATPNTLRSTSMASITATSRRSGASRPRT
jgi:hypothetical protein